MVELVSFIVPAWNEERHLPGTLEAIHASCEGLNYEIVVADDASDDRTAEMAREHGARVVACEHRQIAATRNSGARASKGDLLVFVDADTRVSKGAVHGAVDAIEAGASYGGGNVVFDTRPPLLWRLLLPLMLFSFRVGGLCAGAFLYCTRDAFERTGGFDERRFAAEEAHFSLALRKTGRHAWVQEPVVTSARKLRTYSSSELLGALARISFGGKRRMDLWYGKRRPDPEEPVA